jgi:hypothetical protein
VGADDRGVRGARHRTLIAVAVALACLASGPAWAAPVEPVPVARVIAEARGPCTMGSRWRLAVSHVDEGLRVSLLLRTPREGQRWNIFLEHDAVGIFANKRYTDVDGRISVKRVVPDHDGVDRFRFGANNTETGESCRGRVAA